MADRVDIECYEGEDVRISFVIDPDPESSISGWTLAFKVASTPGGSALITKTTSSGITITDATTGEGYVSLSAANLALTPGRYYYDLARTDSGAAAVLTVGLLVVLANTTLGG